MVPFKIPNNNIYFKRINNTKLLAYTKHLLHKCRSLSEKNTILAAIVNFSKATMMLAHHNSDNLTLKHHPATQLTIKHLQNINYINIDHFQKKKRISAAILAAILWFFMMSARHYFKYFTAAHPLTEATFKSCIHTTLST